MTLWVWVSDQNALYKMSYNVTVTVIHSEI